MLKVMLPVVVVGVAIAGVAIFFSKNLNKEHRVTFTPVEAVAEGSASAKLKDSEPEAVASASAEEKKATTVKILNGSGIKGEAQKLKAALETEGYTISSSGNADNFDYTDTVLQAKASVSASIKEDVKKQLAKLYAVKSGDDLADDAKEDVTVTIGSSKAP